MTSAADLLLETARRGELHYSIILHGPAHEELQAHVLSVNPFDVEATAAALYTGLTIGLSGRRRLNEGAREVVRSNDITRWISRQVQDIRDLVAAPVRA